MNKMNKMIKSKIDELLTSSKEISENERNATEKVIQERLGETAPPPMSGRAGNSPYSPQTTVYRSKGADVRGARVDIAIVYKSHNGAGAYKGRGRWAYLCLIGATPHGEYAVCYATDRDAVEVGSSGLYLRSWETHEREEASRGMGAAQDSLLEAFEALGL